MRKNYEKKNFFEKFENNHDKEEKKINLSYEMNIDNDKTKNKFKDKRISFNNINNINEI